MFQKNSIITVYPIKALQYIDKNPVLPQLTSTYMLEIPRIRLRIIGYFLKNILFLSFV